jgi:hypothetical protein
MRLGTLKEKRLFSLEFWRSKSRALLVRTSCRSHHKAVVYERGRDRERERRERTGIKWDVLNEGGNGEFLFC